MYVGKRASLQVAAVASTLGCSAGTLEEALRGRRARV